MSENVIEVADVRIRYGRKEAVRDVSLAVERGAVYALLGRNGAGKSSLIRALLGQLKPASGSLRIFGSDVWTHRARLMNDIGVVPEEPDAPPEMRVEQIVKFCASLYPRWNHESVWARLDRFGVPRRGVFGSLSKGQKGQVGLAMALAFEPRLVVLDDPTLGLDAVARRVFFDELIADLADRGTTVFMTTHDLAAAEPLVTHVGIMRDGALVLNEEVDSLKRRFRRIRAQKQVELQPLHAVRTQASPYGFVAEVANYDDVLFERVRSDHKLDGAEVGAMSLEEIFVAVTGEREVQS